MEEFDTVMELQKQGKLDKRLRFRLLLLGALSLGYCAAVMYDVFFKGFNWLIAIGFFAISFIIGYLFLTRVLFPVKWDEQRQTVILGRIDLVGFVLLLVYLYIEFTTKSLLAQQYKNVVTVSGATYAVFFGIIFGRLIGTLVTIHRVHGEHR